MRRVLVLSAVALFLLGMTVNVALAGDGSKAAMSDFMNENKPAESIVSTVRSICFWGFYINNPSQGWETRLFVSNLDPGALHNFDAVILQTSTISVRSFSLPPNGIAGFTCADLNTCGQAGWLFVESDANFFGATLFIINNVFGGGAFTAQSPLCEFFLGG